MNEGIKKKGMTKGMHFTLSRNALFEKNKNKTKKQIFNASIIDTTFVQNKLLKGANTAQEKETNN